LNPLKLTDIFVADFTTIPQFIKNELKKNHFQKIDFYSYFSPTPPKIFINFAKKHLFMI